MKQLRIWPAMVITAIVIQACGGDDMVEIVNEPPTVTGVKVSGELKIGAELTVDYTYSDKESDKEGNTTFKWFVSDNENGNNAKEVGSSINYIIQEADTNKYLAAAVVPRQSNGTEGEAVTSTFLGPVETPEKPDEPDTSENQIKYGDEVLTIQSAYISDSNGANNYSDQHYEYGVGLSDGIDIGGGKYENGKYLIVAELQSPGTDTFRFGTYNHCFFTNCPEGIENKFFVSHLFIVEDENDDDIIDFSKGDPSVDAGGKGAITFTKVEGDTYTISYDLTIDNGRKLTGSYTGKFEFFD